MKRLLASPLMALNISQWVLIGVGAALAQFGLGLGLYFKTKQKKEVYVRF